MGGCESSEVRGGRIPYLHRMLLHACVGAPPRACVRSAPWMGVHISHMHTDADSIPKRTGTMCSCDVRGCACLLFMDHAQTCTHAQLYAHKQCDGPHLQQQSTSFHQPEHMQR